MLSQEPNSKMDELLRAYAKKRREQGEPPLPMHPATRKLLQDEVKRTLGAAVPPPPHSWQTLRWPLLALGGGFAALIVMFAVINAQMRQLMPAGGPVDRTLSDARPIRRNPARVAEGTTSPAPIVAAQEKKPDNFKDQSASRLPVAGSISTITVAAPAAPAATPQTGLATADQPSSVNFSASQRLDLPKVQAAAPGQPLSAGNLNAASLGVSAPAPLADKSVIVLPAFAARAGASMAPGAPGPAPTGAAEPVAKREIESAGAQRAVSGEVSDAAGGEALQTQNFTRAQATQPSLSNILSSFRLQRFGQNVRVVDADGSVYDGQVLRSVSGGGGSGAPARRAGYGAARKSLDTNETANWSFKVTGTNNHLQQTVVFVGNVEAMPGAIPLNVETARSRSASQPQIAPASAAVRPAAKPLIRGKVQVGDGKEYLIEAKPPLP